MIPGGERRSRALHDDLPEPVSPSNEVKRRPLVGIWRQEDLPEWSTEGVYSSGKVQSLQDVKLAIIQAHSKLLIKANEARVKGAMVRGGEGNSVSHMIRASVRSHRQNVSCVNQPQLHSRNGAAVSIGEQNLTAETCQSRQAAHFRDHALARRG
jgi:hypothetical protein